MQQPYRNERHEFSELSIFRAKYLKLWQSYTLMISINVKAEFGSAFKALDNLPENLREKVIARTLNRIGDSTKTEATREISREFNIKASTVRERIVVRRAFAGTRLAVEIAVPSKSGKRAINVIHFGARQSKRGVTVKVKRGGSRKPLKAAFIGNAGRTVFSRINPKTGVKSGRLPIFPVQSIDVPQMFNARRITAKLLANVRTKFPVEFERQLRFALASFK